MLKRETYDFFCLGKNVMTMSGTDGGRGFILFLKRTQ